MEEENFREKYIKYKSKYLELKKQIGHGPRMVGRVPVNVSSSKKKIKFIIFIKL